MLLAEEYNLGLCLSRVHRRRSDSVLLVDTDRTLIYTWKCFAVFRCLRRASLPSVASAAIVLLSSPVAEQYLTVEDGPLSHRLQLSRNLRDSPGFVDFVPGP